MPICSARPQKISTANNTINTRNAPFASQIETQTGVSAFFGTQKLPLRLAIQVAKLRKVREPLYAAPPWVRWKESGLPPTAILQMRGAAPLVKPAHA